MASRDPFFYSKKNFVLSITCTCCGNNMYCFRRSPVSTGERQWFYCVGCSNEIERTAGIEPSDHPGRCREAVRCRPPALKAADRKFWNPLYASSVMRR